jgi:hypothetical protein
LAGVVQQQMFCQTFVAIQFVFWLNNVLCWSWLPELLSDLSARLLEESNILYGGRVWLQIVSKDVVVGNLKIILNTLWALSVFLSFENNTACREIDLFLSSCGGLWSHLLIRALEEETCCLTGPLDQWNMCWSHSEIPTTLVSVFLVLRN